MCPEQPELLAGADVGRVVVALGTGRRAFQELAAPGPLLDGEVQIGEEGVHVQRGECEAEPAFEIDGEGVHQFVALKKYSPFSAANSSSRSSFSCRAFRAEKT